jgi:MYXO-CTERM domain-containing protein
MRSVLFLTLLGASLTLPAQAYELKRTTRGAPVHWPVRGIDLVWSPTGSLNRDNVLASALPAVSAEWSGRANLRVRAEKGARGLGAEYVRGTNANVIFYVTKDWSWDEEMLAVTLVRFETDSGTIVDADIAINAVDYDWADRASRPKAGAFDLANTLTHEVGHAIGLAHSAVADATLYPTTAYDDLAKRTLDDDDVAGTEALYASVSLPLTSDEGEAAAGDDPNAPAGCSASSAQTALWPALAALLPAFARRRRRRAARALAAEPTPRAAARGGGARASAAIAAALALGAPTVARAAELADTPDAVVAARADAIAEATVVRQWTEPGPAGAPKTVSEFALVRCVVGACPATMVVEQPGGVDGATTVWVPGYTLLEVGARVAFAGRAVGARWRVVGGDEGVLGYARSGATLGAAAEARIARVVARWAARRESPARARVPSVVSPTSVPAAPNGGLDAAAPR